jgi:hypothetical protein
MTYVDTYEARLQKDPDRRGAIINKARLHYCSLVIGREFGETIEQWHERRPEVAEFGRWVEEHGDD